MHRVQVVHHSVRIKALRLGTMGQEVHISPQMARNAGRQLVSLTTKPSNSSLSDSTIAIADLILGISGML